MSNLPKEQEIESSGTCPHCESPIDLDDFYVCDNCRDGIIQPRPRAVEELTLSKVSEECLTDLLISRLEALAKGHIEQPEFVKAYAETCLAYTRELQKRQGQ